MVNLLYATVLLNIIHPFIFGENGLFGAITQWMLVFELINFFMFMGLTN